MTQIANARNFDGIDDKVEFSHGGLEIPWTGWTVATICKPDAITAFHCMYIERIASGSAFPSIYLRDNAGADIMAIFLLGSVDNGPTAYDDEWQLVAWTKADGTATSRMHHYRYSTTTWSRANAGGTDADPATLGAGEAVQIGGTNSAGEWFSGLIACVGVWKNAALSDGTLDGMVSTIASWEAQSPTALWLLNQTSTSDSINDRTAGGANQSALTGTTVQAVSDLAFDVGGAEPTYHRAGLLGVS